MKRFSAKDKTTLSPADKTKPARHRRVWLGIIFSLLAFAVFWYNGHRKIGWRETLDPAYWLARWQGKDLYLPEKAFLISGNRRLPEVALTFDDGPHPESRGKILDILKEYGAKGTFFDVGIHIRAHPDLVLRTLREGSEIGNHSMNHNRLPGLSVRDRHREINDTDIAYYEVTGRHLNLLRPPGMRHNDQVTSETKALGYIVVGYTAASEDYNPAHTPEQIAESTLRKSDNGSIILLHDYPGPAEALPHILQKLKANGYRFVTISEMISHLPDKPRQQALAFRESFDASQNAAALPATPKPAAKVARTR